MKYTNLLTKHGIDPKTLSPALKRLVKQYTDVQDEIDKGKAKIESGKLTDAKKQKLEEDLVDAANTLEQIDEALCTGIEEWQKNRAKNLAKGQELKKAREAKKNATASSTAAGSGAATPAATAPATQTPAQPATQAAATPAATTPATTAGNQEPATKKSNTGWVIGGIGIFVGILALIAGVKYYNDQKQTI